MKTKIYSFQPKFDIDGNPRSAIVYGSGFSAQFDFAFDSNSRELSYLSVNLFARNSQFLRSRFKLPVLVSEVDIEWGYDLQGKLKVLYFSGRSAKGKMVLLSPHKCRKFQHRFFKFWESRAKHLSKIPPVLPRSHKDFDCLLEGCLPQAPWNTSLSTLASFPNPDGQTAVDLSPSSPAPSEQAS